MLKKAHHQGLKGPGLVTLLEVNVSQLEDYFYHLTVHRPRKYFCEEFPTNACRMERVVYVYIHPPPLNP